MNRKNVLFIIPEMSMGGAQRSLYKISSELQAYYNVWIVVFNRNHKIADAHDQEVLSLDVTTGNGPFTKFMAFWKRVKALKKVKQQLKIDVSISFLEGADYVNILSRQAEKTIISLRGSKLYDENMRRQNFFFRTLIIRMLYRRAKAIVCVNKGISRELTGYFGIKRVPIHMIHNFYDIQSIGQSAELPLTDELRSWYSDPVIAMSGRLAIEKGHRFVIKVFSSLKNVHPRLRLVLIGDGPMRESLMIYCRSLNLEVEFRKMSCTPPDVFITGEQNNVFNHLRASTLYILNSSSEGFPNGLAEAMATGLPVLTADCPYGPREILSPNKEQQGIYPEFAEYGILLPMATAEEKQDTYDIWIKTISDFLNSPQLLEKYSGLGLIRAGQFSKSEAIELWRKVIEA